MIYAFEVFDDQFLGAALKHAFLFSTGMMGEVTFMICAHMMLMLRADSLFKSLRRSVTWKLCATRNDTWSCTQTSKRR
jgi:hypothetical protein